jgi:hypothetical protein
MFDSAKLLGIIVATTAVVVVAAIATIAVLDDSNPAIKE